MKTRRNQTQLDAPLPSKKEEFVSTKCCCGQEFFSEEAYKEHRRVYPNYECRSLPSKGKIECKQCQKVRDPNNHWPPKMYCDKHTSPTKECKHQFWKDRNPPNCFNCGKTERELLSKSSASVVETKEWEEKLEDIIFKVDCSVAEGKLVTEEIKQFISSLLKEQRAELIEEIEGMKKGITTGTLGGMKATYVDTIWDKYNQALDDALDSLERKK